MWAFLASGGYCGLGLKITLAAWTPPPTLIRLGVLDAGGGREGCRFEPVSLVSETPVEAPLEVSGAAFKRSRGLLGALGFSGSTGMDLRNSRGLRGALAFSGGLGAAFG